MSERLGSLYPDPQCGLLWQKDTYRLVIMAILSAQCTDERVNTVAETLFVRFPDFRSLARADISDIEREIRSVGLFRTKANALSECAKRVCSVYGGEVPSDMDALLTLRGVGRKVANLIRGDAFSLGGIVADTHCMRVSYRLGLITAASPAVCERELGKLIPLSEQSGFCHRVVLFGREFCASRSPKCASCPLAEICEYRTEI